LLAYKKQPSLPLERRNIMKVFDKECKHGVAKVTKYDTLAEVTEKLGEQKVLDMVNRMAQTDAVNKANATAGNEKRLKAIWAKLTPEQRMQITEAKYTGVGGIGILLDEFEEGLG
jgi:hypothetical protein